MVRNEFPQVHLLQNKNNVGFAAANNQVLGHCSTPYTLLLNPDTYVDYRALDRLKRFLDDHSEVGAVGPKIVHPQGKLRVLSCGYFPSVRTVFNQYSLLSAIFPRVHAFHGVNLRIGVHDDQPRQVEWLSGACLLIRREVIEQVGLLSNQWFMYAEDHEWCWRIGLAGWKLFHVPEATIKHYTGASSTKNKLTHSMWVQSTRGFYVHRTQPSSIRLLAFDIVLVLGLGLRSVIYWVLGHLGGDRAALWRAEASVFAAHCRAALQYLRGPSRIGGEPRP